METDISWAVNLPDDKYIPNSTSNGFKPYGLNYNSIFTYGIQAIKELDIIVQELKIKINNLESENDILTAWVEELERG